MHILVVKTSSLGDIVHAFPAMTDLMENYRGATIHWVAEKSFADVPRWHPAVKNVIPVSLRRWRKSPFSAATQQEWHQFKKELRSFPYDVVIDAQGLMKSAFVTRHAQGTVCGLDWRSAWEPLASLFYKVKVKVDPSMHAIDRMRHLFANIMDYEPSVGLPIYGIDKNNFSTQIKLPVDPFVVLCHGTTWVTKLWPEQYWLQLAKRCQQEGYNVLLPWGNEEEYQRAQRIASQVDSASILPKLSLTEVAGVLAHAKAAVAVDTGLAHIAAALDVPTVSVYGPTNPKETGALGERQIHLAADFKCAPCKSEYCQIKSKADIDPPCFSTVTPEKVWRQLFDLIQRS